MVAEVQSVQKGNGMALPYRYFYCKAPVGKNYAIFVEARFRFGTREFSLTQPAQVFKK